MDSPPPVQSTDEGFGKTCNVVTWVLTGISFVAVALRLVSRQLKKDVGVDDITIVVSLCFLLGYNALISKSISEGIGAHIGNLSKQQIMGAVKWVTITNAVAVHCFLWPKLAVVLLLKRLLMPGRAMLGVLFGSWFLLFLCVIVLDYLLVGICTPVALQWDKTLKGHCLSAEILTNFAIFSGAFSATLDLAYALYPIYTIFKLQMSIRRRIGYGSIMSLGIVAFIFTIYKCTKLPALNDPPDATYLSAQLLLWTDIESNVVTLAACIPTLSPLVRLIKDKTLSSLKYSSSRLKYGDGGKSPGASRRSRHIRLDETDSNFPLGTNGNNTLKGNSFEGGKYVGASAIQSQRRTNDLESGPPSSDEIELLDNPAHSRNRAWAGKPDSARGGRSVQDGQQARNWNEPGIARNVEVSVTESRRGNTPERPY